MSGSGKIKITETMKKCKELLLNGDSQAIFLTGVAGTGKSVTLKYVEKCLTDAKRNIVKLAPTGIAALNVGGQTIHSFCKFGFNYRPLSAIKKNKELSGIVKKIDVVIVDEISMVSAYLFDAMNRFFQVNSGNSDFFGGKSLLMIGDMFQLPPVIDTRKSSDMAALAGLGYDPNRMSFFNAKSINDCDNLQTLELTEVFRQKDAKFVSLLNKIRKGEFDGSDLSFINLCTKNKNIESDKNAIILCTTNAIADEDNRVNLDKLKGATKTYTASKTGTFAGINLDSRLPAQSSLILKVGAKVMVVKNAFGCVNGDIGHVEKMTDDIITIIVNGRSFDIEKTKWEDVEYAIEEGEVASKSIGVFQQFPLRLGYAITIHKSQGQTFNKVCIKMGYGAFAHGQTYVALSRCVAIDNLYLEKEIRSKDVIVSSDVKSFYARIGS